MHKVHLKVSVILLVGRLPRPARFLKAESWHYNWANTGIANPVLEANGPLATSGESMALR
jgi:hypothetical protein